MCTVTYIPSGTAVYLTSNRDEKPTRSKALTPQITMLKNGEQFLFPQDPDGGGSWIGLKANGDAAVLLNGAFVAHLPKPPYKKSRGLIFLQVIQSTEPLQAFRQLNLCGIEPFTAVLFINKKLHECRWDGADKFEKELNPKAAYIWSSATLYDREMQLLRQVWFDEFLRRNPQPDGEGVLHFHRYGGNGDPAIDIQMNRQGKVKTVSITSLFISNAERRLSYFDVLHNTKATQSFFGEIAALCKEAAYV